MVDPRVTATTRGTNVSPSCAIRALIAATPAVRGASCTKTTTLLISLVAGADTRSTRRVAYAADASGVATGAVRITRPVMRPVSPALGDAPACSSTSAAPAQARAGRQVRNGTPGSAFVITAPPATQAALRRSICSERNAYPIAPGMAERRKRSRRGRTDASYGSRVLEP